MNVLVLKISPLQIYAYRLTRCILVPVSEGVLINNIYHEYRINYSYCITAIWWQFISFWSVLHNKFRFCPQVSTWSFVDNETHSTTSWAMGSRVPVQRDTQHHQLSNGIACTSATRHTAPPAEQWDRLYQWNFPSLITSRSHGRGKKNLYYPTGYTEPSACGWFGPGYLLLNDINNQ